MQSCPYKIINYYSTDRYTKIGYFQYHLNVTFENMIDTLTSPKVRMPQIIAAMNRVPIKVLNSIIVSCRDPRTALIYKLPKTNLG